MNRVLQKLILFAVATPFFLSGCVTTHPQSTIVDNKFHSKKPELIVNFNPEFSYVGFFYESKDLTRREYYVFVNTNKIQENFPKDLSPGANENEVIEGVTIVFNKADRSYRSDLYGTTKNKLYSGVEAYAGKNYQYVIKKVYPSINASVPNFLFENGGYVIPSCILQKGIRRVVGNTNILIEVGYYENIIKYGFSCSAFPMDGNALNKEELEFIEEFDKRSKLAFEVITSQ
jgi:hypothetical protein